MDLHSEETDVLAMADIMTTNAMEALGGLMAGEEYPRWLAVRIHERVRWAARMTRLARAISKEWSYGPHVAMLSAVGGSFSLSIGATFSSMDAARVLGSLTATRSEIRATRFRSVQAAATLH
jgi:hypothetical protein